MSSTIFLDIDGVLNTVPPQRPIEPEKVKLLAQIVHTTGAKIILHSGWRVWFDNRMLPLRDESADLVRLFAQEGLTLSGMTPDLTTEEIRRTKKFSLVKAAEILAWLNDHPGVQHWLVLDDLDLRNNAVAAHQVTPISSLGLTENDIPAAIRMLQGGAHD